MKSEHSIKDFRYLFLLYKGVHKFIAQVQELV